ncbi:MAG: NIPSNAP family protein [Oscillospiraceae bacterium]|nr:NIPSNAP family protein [Oscillospiraceae bacterium]
MIHELRIYHLYPGRTQAILKRFDERMFAFLKKHGVKVIDFYTDGDGKDTIYYICEFDSIEAKDAAWQAAYNDPELMEIKEIYDVDGEILKSFESYTLTRNDFFKR